MVDASVSFKWYVEEHDTEHASGVAVEAEEGRVVVHVPETWRAECANAIWKGAHLRKLFSEAEARDALDELAATRVRTNATARLMIRSYAVAAAHGCSFYDGLGIALAERLRAPLLTADTRQAGAARACGVDLVWE